VIRRLVDELTRRRFGGAVLVLAGVAIIVAVLVGGSGGGDDGTATTATAAKTPPIRAVSVPQLGLRFAHPSSWQRDVDGRTFHLRSPDGSVALTLASPVAGQDATAVRAALEDALRGRFSRAKVLREGPARLGDRKATSFEMTGREHGHLVRALGLVDATPYRTYAVTLVTSASPPTARLAEAQAILASLRFSKPRAKPRG
jgi:hypothetical protein